MRMKRCRHSFVSIVAGMTVLGVSLFASTLWAQQKLVFKDGAVEKVESYEVKGDRVRFKSLDRHEWEEVPLSLVDLDATKQWNQKESERLKSVQARPLAKPGMAPDKPTSPTKKPDAPVEVAPGVNLPNAYGVYAWDGKNLIQLPEAGTRKHKDKKNAVINMVAPAPIMKQISSIQLEGVSSDTRLHVAVPVFYAYLPEDRAAQLSLYRMIVAKNARVLKEFSHSQITGSDSERTQDYIFTPSLHVGENVYKIFPTKPLEEGEYCLVEVSPSQGQETSTVWDFSIVK
jgi:hypothetical protein